MDTTVKSRIPNGIDLSEKAIAKIQESIQQAAKDGQYHYFRVYISGGGCSGLKYEFKIDDQFDDLFDKVFDYQGFKLVIDGISFNYLKGAKVDFVQSLMGSKFEIENPNVQTSCSCGASFSV